MSRKNPSAPLSSFHAKRSACSASPTTPAGATPHRRRRDRRRAPARIPLWPARRPTGRRSQGPRLPRRVQGGDARAARCATRTNGWSGSRACLDGFFACAASMRKIGQRGSQTETMRDMIVLHYPFAWPSVANAFEVQMPPRMRRGRSGRVRLPRCRCASASPPRSIPDRAPAGTKKRKTAIGGGEMQPLAQFQVELVDDAGDGGRRADRNASSMAQRVCVRCAVSTRITRTGSRPSAFKP